MTIQKKLTEEEIKHREMVKASTHRNITKRELYFALDKLYSANDELRNFLWYNEKLNFNNEVLSPEEEVKLKKLQKQMQSTWEWFYYDKGSKK